MKTLLVLLALATTLYSAEQSGTVTDRAGQQWYLTSHPDRGGNVINVNRLNAGKKEFITTIWPSERQSTINAIDEALKEARDAEFQKTPGPAKKRIGKTNIGFAIDASGDRWVLVSTRKYTAAEALSIRNFLNDLESYVSKLP